jgi:polyphosphate kinase 2
MAQGHRKKTKPGKDKKKNAKDDLPAAIAPTTDAPRIKTRLGSFDLDDPELPKWIEDRASTSGGYPYDEHFDDDVFATQLTKLQIELVKLQSHVNAKGLRLVLLFEGRDAAGKGGAIFAFRQYMSPRTARIVALPSPTDRERGQWYFQRYVSHLPTAGEIVLFDRSWYNRAGVEPVMGFCTRKEHEIFLEAAPGFEKMIVDEGALLFKFWLEIGREMQLKRFHERRHDPLKIWKLSSIDYAAMQKWDEYSAARDQMFAATHMKATPWTVVLANDKRRARLDVIRHVLCAIAYTGKDDGAVGRPDPLILGGPELVGAE